jgi:hypothetical protein
MVVRYRPDAAESRVTDDRGRQFRGVERLGHVCMECRSKEASTILGAW